MKSGAAGLRRARGRLGPCDRGGPDVAGDFMPRREGQRPLALPWGAAIGAGPGPSAPGGRRGVSPRHASCGRHRPRPSERAPLVFGGARPRPRCARRPRAPTLGAPTAGAEGPPPQAGRRRPPASHRHARKGRPVAPAPWRACARSERARRAGPAAGMARHRPSRAVCPPLRGQGGLGGAFRPPGKDNDGVRPACRGAMRCQRGAAATGAAAAAVCGASGPCCAGRGRSRPHTARMKMHRARLSPRWRRVAPWHAGCGAGVSASGLCGAAGACACTRPACASTGAASVQPCAHRLCPLRRAPCPLGQGAERGDGRTVARMASLGAGPGGLAGLLGYAR